MLKLSWLLVGLILFVMPTQASTLRPQSDCAQFTPWGWPQPLTNVTLLCRSAFVIGYNYQARVPVWAAWQLTREQVLSCAPRPTQFQPDPALPRHMRSDPADYRRSGFDQGHIVPNGDLTWHRQGQQDSFFMSNIAPQLPALNRGLWRELEGVVRAWAFERGDLIIQAGSVLTMPPPRTIGANQVHVPVAFYKLITHVQSGVTLAFLLEHTDNQPTHVRHVQTSVMEVSRRTGIQFHVPGTPDQIAPLWRINTRSLARERSRVCGSTHED